MASLVDISTLINGAVEKLTSNINEKINEICINFDNKLVVLNDDVNMLKKRIATLEDQVNRCSRSNQINIRNIPYTRNENLHNIFRAISSAIGFNKTTYDQHIFRVLPKGNLHKPNMQSSDPVNAIKSRLRNKTSNNGSYHVNVISPTIVVHFATPWDKSLFMNMYFKHITLNLAEVGFSSDVRVYISENLTSVNYNIFRQATLLKKQGTIFKIQISNGLVYICRAKDDKPLLISDINMLT